HVLPNTVALILVIGSSQFATMVLLESGLSFLGMGIQAPRPSWGLMLAEGRDYLSNAWWLATALGLMIALVVLGANLLGDGLRDQEIRSPRRLRHLVGPLGVAGVGHDLPAHLHPERGRIRLAGVAGRLWRHHELEHAVGAARLHLDPVDLELRRHHVGAGKER